MYLCVFSSSTSRCTKARRHGRPEPWPSHHGTKSVHNSQFTMSKSKQWRDILGEANCHALFDPLIRNEDFRLEQLARYSALVWATKLTAGSFPSTYSCHFLSAFTHYSQDWIVSCPFLLHGKLKTYRMWRPPGTNLRISAWSIPFRHVYSGPLALLTWPLVAVLMSPGRMYEGLDLQC